MPTSTSLQLGQSDLARDSHGEGRHGTDDREGVAKSAIKDSYIRLVVTRGVGEPRSRSAEMRQAHGVLHLRHDQALAADRLRKGLTALTAATPIHHRESLSPRVKSLNYLSHILAKVEGIAAGWTR